MFVARFPKIGSMLSVNIAWDFLNSK